MTKEFRILGAFVDQDIDRVSEEDLTPKMFTSATKDLKEGDELHIHVNSCGGSVTSGISIANSIKALSSKGVKTIAHIDGIAASIASVVVCACEKVVFPRSSFLMVHNCWSVVQGNSNDLRKEADIMDKMNEAIMSFLLEKFDLEESEMKVLLDNETWILGSEAESYKFRCEVVDGLKINNKIVMDERKFKNIPKALFNGIQNMEDITKEQEVVKADAEPMAQDDKKEVQEVNADAQAVVEEVKDEEVQETTEEVKEEVKDEVKDEVKEEVLNKDEVLAKFKEYENKIAELEKTPTQDEINKRVSGMQSTMQNKINELTKDFQDKIEILNKEIRVKDEELVSIKNEITSLTSTLESTKKELSEKASALEETKCKLAALNANVLTPSEVTNWRELKGKEFFDYLKKNPEVTK